MFMYFLKKQIFDFNKKPKENIMDFHKEKFVS